MGAAWLRRLAGDNRGYGYVDEVTLELSLAILPAYRGQGIGSRLLASLVEIARPHCPGICLSVDADNPAGSIDDSASRSLVDTGHRSQWVKRWEL